MNLVEKVTRRFKAKQVDDSLFELMNLASKAWDFLHEFDRTWVYRKNVERPIDLVLYMSDHLESIAKEGSGVTPKGIKSYIEGESKTIEDMLDAMFLSATRASNLMHKFVGEAKAIKTAAEVDIVTTDDLDALDKVIGHVGQAWANYKNAYDTLGKMESLLSEEAHAANYEQAPNYREQADRAGRIADRLTDSMRHAASAKKALQHWRGEFVRKLQALGA
jgi:plasmid maintenance system antidote protein VapI